MKRPKPIVYRPADLNQTGATDDDWNAWMLTWLGFVVVILGCVLWGSQ